MRKSVKLGPGVRLNVSRRGAGVRVGGRRAGVSVHSSGRRSASVGYGGVGYSKQWGGSSRRSGGGAQRRPSTPPTPPPRPPKPGLFAPAYEKAFHKAINAYANGDVEKALMLFQDAAERDTSGKAISDELFAGLLCAQLGGRDEDAIRYLEAVVTAEQELPDALMTKYVSGGQVTVPVTEHVAVEVPFGSLAAALILAEVYQRNGRGEEAIGLLQQLIEVNPDPYLLLSLCDLYAEAEAWEEIVDMAAGCRNEDDVSLQVRLYQAAALQQQGMREAALEAYKDALRSKKRDPELLREARYARAVLYLEMGKKAQGRKELEKLYADDPSYRDVAERLNS